MVETVIVQLGALRAAIERLVPTLDYYKASALSDYLRPMYELASDRTRETYPWRKEDEPA